MVQPAGFEPATSSFAGRHSNPTELRLHMFLNDGIVCIFEKLQGENKISLLASWHTIKIKSLEVYHWFGNIIFLLSFFKKSSFINDSHLNQLIDIFCWKLFLWEGFLILHISSSFFVWEIESRLLIFVSSINEHRFFLSFWKLSSGCLFFYETCWESMRIGHVLFR